MLNVSPRPARRRPLLTAALALTVALGAALAGRADAQTPTPRHGGNLVLAITSEPDTLDCHAGTSFTVVHHLAPHYSFLLRYDPDRFPAVVGDLAEGWSVSPDGLVYTFRIRDGVRFHDGTPLTAADVAASYERLRNPPTGVISVRRSEFESIGAIEVPDPRTVVFRLRYPDASLLAGFASPWNCIYSAARLAADPTYPQREVMGSGPFRFVARQPGTEWRGERFDHYYVAGQPYLIRLGWSTYAGRDPQCAAGRRDPRRAAAMTAADRAGRRASERSHRLRRAARRHGDGRLQYAEGALRRSQHRAFAACATRPALLALAAHPDQARRPGRRALATRRATSPRSARLRTQVESQPRRGAGAGLREAGG